MRIVMMTNVYHPHVGGVARSVERFTEAYRAEGHEVLVVAPRFESQEERPGEVRLPAMQKFNGSDFAVVVPIPLYLTRALEEFAPDIVHSHHPFMVGDTALRVSAYRGLPLVFTHHTMYEHYTHYVPLDAHRLRTFVKELCTGYANSCDHVIAPSNSVRDVIRERGVETPITVIPTGVDMERFESGDGARFREDHGIPGNARLVGHVGRLALEKNLDFLTESVCRFLARDEGARFLVVGDGPRREAMEKVAKSRGLADRVHLAGQLTDQPLVDAYHAMDVFAFSSKSETQGMVLVEAMAAGTPVVALEASGVRDVLDDGRNGCLVEREDEAAFAEALARVFELPEGDAQKMRGEALATARDFATETCARKALGVYEETLGRARASVREQTDLRRVMEGITREWELWRNRFEAASAVVHEAADSEAPPEEPADR